MISREDILKRITETELTNKMKKSIQVQVSRFFDRVEEEVIDYELYDKIKAYKSYTALEKAVIAYRACERLSYEGCVDTDYFLEHWEDDVREYMLDELSTSITDTLHLSTDYITDEEIRILKSKNKYFKNNGYETNYRSWAVSIREKASEKCNKCHFVKRYKGIDIYDVDVEIAGYSDTKDGNTLFATVRLYEKMLNNGRMDDFVYRIVA